jgi:hypothetical protein
VPRGDAHIDRAPAAAVIIAMDRYLSVTALLLASTSALHAQTADRKLELIFLSRVALINGVNIEYAVTRRVVPWVSVRYGTHNASCDDIFTSSDCGDSGLSVMGGVRLPVAAGPVEPYLTLGAGNFWMDSGTEHEITGTFHLGIVVPRRTRLRARIEFGYESHVSPLFNFGIGFKP